MTHLGREKKLLHRCADDGLAEFGWAAELVEHGVQLVPRDEQRVRLRVVHHVPDVLIGNDRGNRGADDPIVDLLAKFRRIE